MASTDMGKRGVGRQGIVRRPGYGVPFDFSVTV